MTKDGKRCPSSFPISGEGNTFSVCNKGDTKPPTEHRHGKLLKNDAVSIDGYAASANRCCLLWYLYRLKPQEIRVNSKITESIPLRKARL